MSPTRKTGPRRLPQQSRSKDRVELILNATAGILAEQGVTAVTTPNIATRAKIPVSSIYQYFPNKAAIFCALYDKYLVQIRERMEQFDNPANARLAWREFFGRLLSAIFIQESQGDLVRELDKAFSIYPELIELDKAHSELIVEKLAGFAKARGSRWSRARRIRMAHFIYSLNMGVWAYISAWNPPKKETREWELAATMAVLEKCFPDAASTTR